METLGIGCGCDASEGGGQLALEDASSNGVGYLKDRVHCLTRGGKKKVLFLRKVQDCKELSIRILHVHRRAGLSTLCET